MEAPQNQFDMTLADSEASVPASENSSTDSAPAMHEDSRSVGGSSGDDTISIDGLEESLPEKMTTIPCMRMLWRWPC